MIVDVPWAKLCAVQIALPSASPVALPDLVRPWFATLMGWSAARHAAGRLPSLVSSLDPCGYAVSGLEVDVRVPWGWRDRADAWRMGYRRKPRGARPTKASPLGRDEHGRAFWVDQ